MGYLVGNLSTMKPLCNIMPDVQISTRNDLSTVTMLPKNAYTEVMPNLGFRDLEILENSDISLLATLTDIENTIYMRQ